MTFVEHRPELLALDAGEHYRFAFEVSACIGCHSCEVACAEQNNLPPDTVWRRVGEIEGGTFPTTKRFHLSLACNHCLEPTCLQGCPTNAYVKLTNGVVQHQADECIGCQYCTWNCPYSVPVFQPDRRIVTKCDMCLPRLSVGLEPACVGACPTHAIKVEKVDIAAWRADHREGDAPNLPSADITLSTTRIVLPEGMPAETFAASDYRVQPEDPHWPLVWLTLLTQAAVGMTATLASLQWRGNGHAAATVVSALVAALALVGSLAHLGQPRHAWKALRNLRRSWLSREVVLFGAYAAASAAHAAAAITGVDVRAAGCVAAAIGALGVFASARLYIVPGRPAWHTWLTVPSFFLPALWLGALLTMTATGSHPAALVGGAIGAAVGQLATRGANWWRLRRSDELESTGSARLLAHRFRFLAITRVTATSIGVVCALVAPMALALLFAACGELVGRYLFYVTVVPLNMPGTFARGRR